MNGRRRILQLVIAGFVILLLLATGPLIGYWLGTHPASLDLARPLPASSGLAAPIIDVQQYESELQSIRAQKHSSKPDSSETAGGR